MKWIVNGKDSQPLQEVKEDRPSCSYWGHQPKIEWNGQQAFHAHGPRGWMED